MAGLEEALGAAVQDPGHVARLVEGGALREQPFLRFRAWAVLLGLDTDRLASIERDLASVELDLPNQRVVHADVRRTRARLEFFQRRDVRSALARILTLYCKRRGAGVSYKQGMTAVLAPFLLLAHRDCAGDDAADLAGKTELQAFAAFYEFTHRFLPHAFADDEFMALQLQLCALRLLAQYHCPSLSRRLEPEAAGVELFATPWLLTAFAHDQPLQPLLRVWDALLAGQDPTTLLFMALALIQEAGDRILAAPRHALLSVVTSLHLDSEEHVDRVAATAAQLRAATPPSVVGEVRRLCFTTGSPPSVGALAKWEALSCLEIAPSAVIRHVPALRRTRRGQTGAAAPPAPPEGGVEEAFVLDCRPLQEYQAEHLAVSTHVPAVETGKAEALQAVLDALGHAAGKAHFIVVGSSASAAPTPAAEAAVPRVRSSPVRRAATLAQRLLGDPSTDLSSAAEALAPGEQERVQEAPQGSLATMVALLLAQRDCPYVAVCRGGFQALADAVRSALGGGAEDFFVQDPVPAPWQEPAAAPRHASERAEAPAESVLPPSGATTARPRRVSEAPSTRQTSGVGSRALLGAAWEWFRPRGDSTSSERSDGAPSTGDGPASLRAAVRAGQVSDAEIRRVPGAMLFRCRLVVQPQGQEHAAALPCTLAIDATHVLCAAAAASPPEGASARQATSCQLHPLSSLDRVTAKATHPQMLTISFQTPEEQRGPLMLTVLSSERAELAKALSDAFIGEGAAGAAGH